eukprot:scaffold233_cov174-Ochromonas_danica.AAC.13
MKGKKIDPIDQQREIFLHTVNTVVSSRVFQNENFHRQHWALSAQLRSEELSLWKEQVEYVDLNAPLISSPSNTVRTLPLFLLGKPFFPEGGTILNVFEMRYRQLMYDIAKNDDVFGYIHTNGATGQIARIGTLCKVVERQLLEDGRQYIALQGIGRFQVNKIEKTLPYVVAEVETGIEDDPPKEDNEKLLEELERNVYDAVKYYVRLMRTHSSNRDLVLPIAVKANRPTVTATENGERSIAERRTAFSFALCNMIQMTQDREAQLMLQTRDTKKRLMVEKEILSKASELIGDQLVAMQIITSAQRDMIQSTTFGDPFDNDILPKETEEVVEDKEKDEWDLSNMM